ncbi:defensin Lucifensin-like [Uranotaenia lowii]|uniref:defensin Lucifensin-like n=1 Tax=Uranotaenia lowii TaxID=190385 RepID=UPI00247B1771|nr:defensin Lucifensin-like [Uranotaenia lowii]
MKSKLIILSIVFAVFGVDSIRSPVHFNSFEESKELNEMEPPPRAKRATCDLLSGLGIQHSACAASCLARLYRGGFCNSEGICVCRDKLVMGNEMTGRN